MGESALMIVKKDGWVVMDWRNKRNFAIEKYFVKQDQKE